MFIDTIILASLLAIMIIDILAVSKIRLNYQKVYHENTRCWRNRKYWYSCCEYCYCNGPSARGSGQESAENQVTPRGTDIFYGDVSIPETLTDLPKDIDAIIFTLAPMVRDVLAPEQ